MAGAVPLGAKTVRVDIPEPGKLLTDSERVGPGPLVLLVKVTTPEKPSRDATVIVEVQAGPPAATERKVGLAEIPKSGPFTVTNTSVKAVKPVLFPVTVTSMKLSGIVPAGAVTVSVEVNVPGRVRVFGDSAVMSPEALEELVSDTIPANPPKGVTVIVVLFEAPPAITVRERFDETRKPGPVTFTSILRK